MYWTVWAEDISSENAAKIEKAQMDGQKRMTFVEVSFNRNIRRTVSRKVG